MEIDIILAKETNAMKKIELKKKRHDLVEKMIKIKLKANE